MNGGRKGIWIRRKPDLVPVVLSVLIAPTGPKVRYPCCVACDSGSAARRIKFQRYWPEGSFT